MVVRRWHGPSGYCSTRCSRESKFHKTGQELVVPIYKDGDKHIADNYRGITLLSVVGKLYTVVLNTRLSQWCERNQILVDEQAGFREGRSTSDQLFILREAVLDRSGRKKDLLLLFGHQEGV